MTITDILALKFAGNYSADADTFRLIDTFLVRTDVSVPDKVTALQYYSKEGMGLPDRICAVDVFIHIAALQD